MSNITTVFANKFIAIMSDGSYSTSSLAQRIGCEAVEQRPMNWEDIEDEKRGRRLGLKVPEVRPVWKPDSYIPCGGTREEIQDTLTKAAEALVFNPKHVIGRKVVDWQSHHGEGCCCGYCPGETVYGEETETRPGWDIPEGIIPLTWMDGDRPDLIHVQSNDGRWRFYCKIGGDRGWGSLLSPEEAARYGCDDPAILTLLRRQQEEWEKRRTAHRQQEDEAERVRLARKFGIIAE